MKKQLGILTVISLLCSACATDGTLATGGNTQATTAQQLGVTAIKIAINAKCTTEINNQPAWQIVSRTMTAEQQQTVQSNVCGCVSDKALENITAVDLATAAIDPTARATIVSHAVTRTLNQCVAETLKR
ncbi:hypothetical protein [Acinetobacter brisouii]|uniref:hypothetical protein n=1 Tax=Acinetobacter brisouii TaxID=396323 RepID=UPI00124FE033|nr:hypothetical protein [Acinetobacter brisouii]